MHANVFIRGRRRYIRQKVSQRTEATVAWGIHDVSRDDNQALRDLAARTLTGEVAGFRIRGFGTAAECASLAALPDADARRVHSYVGSNVAAAHLGVPAIKHADDAAGYFAAASSWNGWQESVLGEGAAWNAPAAVVALLSRAFPGFGCGVAQDPAAGSYFHGIIRQIARSPLHSDYARRDFPGWLIGGCAQQLAWNVYLTAGRDGEGDTIIYRKPWSPADEVFKHETEMGYGAGVVAGCQSVRFTPAVGDLVVFNCVNYHEVTWTHGAARRLSIGGFIGIDSDARAVRLWS